MDKNAIKKFAVWARTELIARICTECTEIESRRSRTDNESKQRI